MSDPAAIDPVEAFIAALDEQHDAEEFERLMLGDEAAPVRRAEFLDTLDKIDLTYSLDDPSALAALRAERALERLQGRHPDVWERVTLGEGGA